MDEAERRRRWAVTIAATCVGVTSLRDVALLIQIADALAAYATTGTICLDWSPPPDRLM